MAGYCGGERLACATPPARDASLASLPHDPAAPFLSPEQAVERLVELHRQAEETLREALARFAAHGAPPREAELARFRYPELRLSWTPRGPMPTPRRAWAKFQEPGHYATTVTQPAHFRRYLLEQLTPLAEEYGAHIAVGRSEQEMPYPYVLDSGDEFSRGGLSAAELARYFPIPLLSTVGDEIADGLWNFADGRPRPLALFDAVRVDYSLRRLTHYTGTDWRAVQPWILLTNYHRYVDQFVEWGLAELAAPDGAHDSLVLPGGAVVGAAWPSRRPARWWRRRRGTASRCRPITCCGAARRRASASSTSASARPTRRTSPITWRCCGRIAG